MSRKHAIGLGAIELLEKGVDDPSKLSDNARLALEEGQKTSESKLRHATSILNVLAPLSKVVFIAALLLLVAACWLAYRILFELIPDQLIALPLSISIESSVSRLASIATKSQARQLIGLEQNVKDEKSLLEFALSFRAIANEYDFDVPLTMASWLEASEADRISALASVPQPTTSQPNATSD